MMFENLGLVEPLVRAVHAEGYREATPIQAQAIPPLLAGADLMGCAQTGTGKTAAFALPTIQRLRASAPQPADKSQGRRERRKIRALVLAPTRELAGQIGASFAVYGKFAGLRHTVIYGGVGQGPQVRALQAGVDILVATPGRLLDLMNQRYIDLRHVEILILDEADQMLDMGFIHDLRRIVSHVPRERQTLMFSATMPPEIRSLAQEWLRSPKHVQVAPVATPAERVRQSVYFVDARHKPLLLTHVLTNTPCTRALVFARTKHGADKIVKHLTKTGVRAEAIHGNKSQNARQRALDLFKSARPPVLVATDIAARGLDIDGVSHVINYELPEVPEIYVHRIGRTGRAGADGIALSFCGREERGRLKLIERLTRRSIAVVEGQQPDYPREARVATEQPQRKPNAQPQGGGSRPGGQRRKKHRPGRGEQPRGPVSHGDRPAQRAETAKSARPPRRKRRGDRERPVATAGSSGRTSAPAVRSWGGDAILAGL